MEDVANECPDCGSTNLEFPQNIEIRKEGVFIKKEDVQLRGNISSEAIMFVCKECGRKIKARELLEI